MTVTHGIAIVMSEQMLNYTTCKKFKFISLELWLIYFWMNHQKMFMWKIELN